MSNTAFTCINDCGRSATWMRHTQYAGDHPFCAECARKETDFGEDSDYTYWEESAEPKNEISKFSSPTMLYNSVMTMTKEERQQQREEYKLSRQWEFDRDEHIIAEQNRREDIIADRELWSGTVQIGLEHSKSLIASITMADELLKAYRERFQ